jgi:hypothetical protein
MWRCKLGGRGGEVRYRRNRWVYVALVLSLTLISCSAPVVPAPTPVPTSAPPTRTPAPSPTPQPSPLPSATPLVRLEVVAWLNNDAPKVGERLILIATLSINGIYSSGSRMKATWPDRNAPGGQRVCWDSPSYGRGVCYIQVTDQYPPGQPVPIHIEIYWLTQWYSGDISFTPQ